MDVTEAKTERERTETGRPERRKLSLFWHFALLLLFIGLLAVGAWSQLFDIHDDVAKYQCYAVAFWKGLPAVRAFPGSQCSFITHPLTTSSPSNAAIASSLQRHGFPSILVNFVKAQSPDKRFHALPREYPILALITFWSGLIAPHDWYQVAFAGWLAILAGIMYLVLLRYRSSQAAIAFALYLLTGSFTIALRRFDLIPSAFTLFALVCAVRKRWNWAFLL